MTGTPDPRNGNEEPPPPDERLDNVVPFRWRRAAKTEPIDPDPPPDNAA